MTAEIAIMNKEAIAIAADSAVTLREEKGQKIFTSANKIFTLSKYHPVGIMIYGSANFMGVPWETIIKIYRSKLGKKKFDTLKEYADDFIKFLSGENQLFPESEQKKYFQENVYGYFYNRIRKEIEQEVEKIISERRIIKGEIKTNYELRVTNYELNWKSLSRESGGFEPSPILELRIYELRIGRIHPLSPRGRTSSPSETETS